jgi:hypothetical protein
MRELNPMGLPCKYVAAKQITVGTRMVEKGQPVPEADTWSDPSLWIDSGHIMHAKAQDFPAILVEEIAPKPDALPAGESPFLPAQAEQGGEVVGSDPPFTVTSEDLETPAPALSDVSGVSAQEPPVVPPAGPSPAAETQEPEPKPEKKKRGRLSLSRR